MSLQLQLFSSLYFFCYSILFNYNLRKSKEYGSQIHGDDGVDCVHDGGPWGVGVQDGEVSTDIVIISLKIK